jgi:hypothetical protein
MPVAMLARLNRWQRLWIVLGILWLLGPVLLLWKAFPHEQTYIDALVEPQTDKVWSYRKAKAEAVYSECQASKKSGTRDFKECMDAELAKFDAAYDRIAEAIRQDAERRAAKELPALQTHVIVQGIALWFVPLFALYVLGLLLNWLRTRFGKGT